MVKENPKYYNDNNDTQSSLMMDDNEYVPNSFKS